MKENNFLNKENIHHKIKRACNKSIIYSLTYRMPKFCQTFAPASFFFSIVFHFMKKGLINNGMIIEMQSSAFSLLFFLIII